MRYGKQMGRKGRIIFIARKTLEPMDSSFGHAAL